MIKDIKEIDVGEKMSGREFQEVKEQWHRAANLASVSWWIPQ